MTLSTCRWARIGCRLRGLAGSASLTDLCSKWVYPSLALAFPYFREHPLPLRLVQVCVTLYCIDWYEDELFIHTCLHFLADGLDFLKTGRLSL